jgi:para-aminobenzoate synthetase/4-amino-4-deoxychorismate lyase
VIQIPLGVDATVGDVLRALRDHPRPFALTGDWAGSRAIVSSRPTRTVEGREALDVLTDTARGGSAVGGGWFGFLGFPLGAALERLPPAPPRPVPLPDASMAFYDHVYRQDEHGAWWFEALDEQALAHLDLEQAARPFRLTDLLAHHTAHHLGAVADCVERIAVGELFQANICLRLEASFHGSAADAFLAGIDTLKPTHGAFLQLDHDTAILSFSPEQFLRRDGDRVTTSPIKGTGHAAQALANSSKDAAEHVMIVDLSRNDLGRVARYGTVAAGARRVEPHPGLYHLVTDVTARTDATDAELIRAAFPPGSVTGAPKVQALKVIAALEPTQREVYTGAIGFASPHAGLQLNVAIRTLEISGERAWMGCGGGIVADSDPDAELDEALTKARPIAAALGARVLKDWPRRPDPAHGLIETIAVRDGELVDAPAHLARVRTSAAALYGIEVDTDPTPTIDDGRLRIRVSPQNGVTVEQHAETPDPSSVALEPRVLEGGLGAHKWADRTGEPHWLVVDTNGDVLETASANVWALIDGVLTTPPADGRLLPGVTRARMLARESNTAEARLTLDDLERADAVLLTSSIRLVTPAAIARSPTPRAIELAAQLRNNPAISGKTGSYIRLEGL